MLQSFRLSWAGYTSDPMANALLRYTPLVRNSFLFVLFKGLCYYAIPLRVCESGKVVYNFLYHPYLYNDLFFPEVIER